MPRKKSGNFDQNKYVGQFIHENYKWVNINFNVNSEEDMELYTFLQNLKEQGIQKTPYIKGLIKQDLQSRK